MAEPPPNGDEPTPEDESSFDALEELDERIAATRAKAEEIVEGVAGEDADSGGDDRPGDSDSGDGDRGEGDRDSGDDGGKATTADDPSPEDAEHTEHTEHAEDAEHAEHTEHSEQTEHTEHTEHKAALVRAAERRIAASFVVATLAALGLAGVYVAGGQAQAEGALLFVSLGGVGVGLVLWGRHLLGDAEVTDERKELEATEEEREELGEAIEDDEGVGRRRFLGRLLGAAAAALGLAALFPIRSLGPSPGDKLRRTSWTPGARLLDQEGRLVRVDTVTPGSIVTVFPEGHDESADSQAVLVRVEAERMHPRPGRETWAPEGNVAYSKICTHVGCPVALYQAPTHELVCPCHQSTFDVLDGARPTFGPATRSLPQLPLAVDPEGFLVAQGDFDEPVGPGYWSR